MLVFFLLVIALAATARVVYLMWSGYRSAPPGISTWDRWLAAGRESATVLWGNVLTVIGGAIGAVAGIADLAGSPGVASAIQQYMDPQWVAIGMIGIAVVIEIARRRTLE